MSLPGALPARSRIERAEDTTNLDPTISFLARVGAGVLFASLWFGLPGWLLSGAADLGGRWRLLLAPVVGAAVWGTASSLAFHVVPYERLWLSIAFVLFNGSLYILSRKRAFLHSIDRRVWVLVALSLVLGSLAIVEITPVVKDDALFLGSPIYDHAKAAIVDSLAREGLPPVSPYYHPGREVTLNYYYLWHFMASQLRVLLGLSGWEADAALTWFTLSSILALVAALVLRLSVRFVPAVFAMLLVTCGSAITGLMIAVSLCCRGQHVSRLVVKLLPWKQDIQTAGVNAMWAPQHLLAAACLVLGLVIAVDLLEPSDRRRERVCTLGSLLACTFACSAWVALAGVFAAPMVAGAVAAWAWRTGSTRALVSAAPSLAWSALVALMLALPVLFASVGVGAGGGLFTFAAQQTSPSPSLWVNVWLWWAQEVPAIYGATLLLGVLGLVTFHPRSLADQALRIASLAAAPSFLLVSQWVRSAIGANDMGWRAHLPAYLLLCVFAGVTLSWVMSRRPLSSSEHPRPVRGLAKVGVGVVGSFLLGLGLLAGAYPTAYRVFVARRPPAHMLKESEVRRDFLAQQRAWKMVRAFTDTNSIVQSNPDGYSELTPWHINLPYMLFADRASAVATPDTVNVFASATDPKERDLVIRSVRAAFAGSQDPRVYEFLHRRLGIDVLLVDRRDALFHSDVLDRSTLWRLVHEEERFRIYVAKEIEGGGSV